MTGIYARRKTATSVTYRVTLNAEGRETARDALRPAAPFVRVAPPPPADAPAEAPASQWSVRAVALAERS